MRMWMPAGIAVGLGLGGGLGGAEVLGEMRATSERKGVSTGFYEDTAGILAKWKLVWFGLLLV